MLDHTHEAGRTSWVASAGPGSDFPIQNLPFCVFRRPGEAFRGGVGIGDRIVDLAAARRHLPTAACSEGTLNAFFAEGPAAWRAVRHALVALLETGAPKTLADCLVDRASVEFGAPAHIGDYSDFYTSYWHAHNIGKLLGVAGDGVAPSFHWGPLGYHGRASSIGVSGQQVRRPIGQARGDSAPTFGPSAELDYEMELGVFVGPGNAQGEAVPLAEAEDHVFGLCLLNDWSARDLQSWELSPLGPFLSKSFATTISPWIVTRDALAPFRLPWARDAAFPGPPPHLDGASNRASGALDVRIEAWLESAQRRSRDRGPIRLAATSFRHQHWTVAQLVAHHTVGGCNLRPGDLLGTGTISGPTEAEAGALMELSKAGRAPVALDGEERGFLHDGDTVILRGACAREGFVRIGFGECCGTVVPARSSAAG